MARRGFTLVEVMVALTVLLMAAVAFVPLFIYVGEASEANRARLVATKLATSVIEDIRALPYQSIGLVGGNPSGVLERDTVVTVDGRQYTVQVDVWWVDDPADGTGAADPIPNDYKRVAVTVSAPGLFSGDITISTRFDTLASLEGEEEAYPGGNIGVRAWRGWRTTPGVDVPVENVKIELTAGPDAPQTVWTEDDGRALFAVVSEGTYTVTAAPSLLGMMVFPLALDQTVVVSLGLTSEAVFEVERPCRLAVELKNKTTGLRITSPGTIVLETPFMGNVTRPFTAEMQGQMPDSLFGDLWPVGTGYPGFSYGLQVIADGYAFYRLGDDPAPPWDGLFGGPNMTHTVEIGLVPLTASVTVTTMGTGLPVAGATVDVYLHTFTYDEELGDWTDACGGTPEATQLTDSDGKATFALPDIDYEVPAFPEDDDRYYRYCVHVTASGYVDGGISHGAFWVTGGEQWTGGGEIETYEVETQADFRQIRVRAQRTNGNPRNNVRIRVVGPGYDREQTTQSDGETTFANLAAGTYTAYRRSGSSWVGAQMVEAVWGEYFVLYSY